MTGEIRLCEFCGTALPDGVRYCPGCRADVGAADLAATLPAYVPPALVPPLPPASPAQPVSETTVPATARRFSTLGLVAVALVALVGLTLLFLIGMPFGSGDRELERKQVETDTIEEGTAPAASPSLGVDESARIEEIPPLVPPPPNTTATATLPPSDTGAPIVVPDNGGEPRVEIPPAATSQAPPVRPERGAVTETDAIAIVRGAAHSYYDGVTSDCLRVASEGFVNVGYTMNVSDSCRGTALGRWRVDARNGDVFRQREDGRYLKP